MDKRDELQTTYMDIHNNLVNADSPLRLDMTEWGPRPVRFGFVLHNNGLSIVHKSNLTIDQAITWLKGFKDAQSVYKSLGK